MSFEDAKKQFEDLITTIGTQRTLIQDVITGGSISSAKQKAALNALDDAMEELRDLIKTTEIPDLEKKRRIAELEAEIKRIELHIGIESDFDKRMELIRKQSRLNATLATWEAMDVFHFETLLDFSSHDFKTLLEEADKDIKARQNLQRVLKGIEVALSVSAFGAALAAKLAASSLV